MYPNYRRHNKACKSSRLTHNLRGGDSLTWQKRRHFSGSVFSVSMHLQKCRKWKKRGASDFWYQRPIYALGTRRKNEKIKGGVENEIMTGLSSGLQSCNRMMMMEKQRTLVRILEAIEYHYRLPSLFIIRERGKNRAKTFFLSFENREQALNDLLLSDFGKWSLLALLLPHARDERTKIETWDNKKRRDFWVVFGRGIKFLGFMVKIWICLWKKRRRC